MSDKKTDAKQVWPNGGARPGSGRKLYKPTEEQLKNVEALAGYGLAHKHIATLMDVSRSTLLKYYRRQLDRGMALAVAKMLQATYKAGTEGNVRAQELWHKQYSGWGDTTTINHVSSDGSMTPKQTLDTSTLSSQTLAEILAARDAVESKQ